MSWREIYAAKLKTPEEAVKIIHSGDTVLIAHAAWGRRTCERDGGLCSGTEV